MHSQKEPSRDSRSRSSGSRHGDNRSSRSYNERSSATVVEPRYESRSPRSGDSRSSASRSSESSRSSRYTSDSSRTTSSREDRPRGYTTRKLADLIEDMEEDGYDSDDIDRAAGKLLRKMGCKPHDYEEAYNAGLRVQGMLLERRGGRD